MASSASALPPMLDLPGTGQDPEKIDFSILPILKGEHAVVNRGEPPWIFRLHNYLAHFEGRYWCMWSHGPEKEDHPTQHVRFAVSMDGLDWSEPRKIVGPSPRLGFWYIARGFWVRDGRLLALASHDEAYYERGPVHFFGRSLELLAFEWNPKTPDWTLLGVVHDDAINNFPPQLLPTGEWAMTRRDHVHNVSMLIGGVNSPLDWQSWEVTTGRDPDRPFRPGEPEWWLLPDDRMMGVFRNNARSMRLYRAVSTDYDRTWSTPEQTNFPDARAKFFGMRTAHGYYILLSNPNPIQRTPLCLST